MDLPLSTESSFLYPRLTFLKHFHSRKKKFSLQRDFISDAFIISLGNMKLGKNALKNVSESKHNLSHYQPASIPHTNCSIIAVLHWLVSNVTQSKKWYVNLPFKLQFLILWHFEYYSCASKWRCPFWRSRQFQQLTVEGGPHYHCLYTVDWLVINNKKGMCPSVYILGDFILPLV